MSSLRDLMFQPAVRFIFDGIVKWHQQVGPLLQLRYSSDLRIESVRALSIVLKSGDGVSSEDSYTLVVASGDRVRDAFSWSWEGIIEAFYTVWAENQDSGYLLAEFREWTSGTLARVLNYRNILSRPTSVESWDLSQDLDLEDHKISVCVRELMAGLALYSYPKSF